ncbi:MAG: NFACT family protein [Oscillospiraceae bacterium]|nr:NFACT family protein [Oscillospiraceae bacterium]
MPYDAGVAAAVCSELNETVAGGRIEKIIQPTKEQVILQVYSKNKRHNLCLDADASAPKVYITTQAAENPPFASAFYSILRKYLINAKINSVSLVGFDRIFEFAIDASDEMGFQRPLLLYVECIRKQGNIIICETPFEKSKKNEKRAKIIGAIKPVDFSMSEVRQILSGLLYEPPSPGDKANPLETSQGDFFAAIEKAAKESFDLPVCDFLLAEYQGFSPLIARELVFRVSKSVFLCVGEVDKTAFWFHFSELAKKIKNGEFSPVMLSDEKAPIDFSYTEIRQYGNKAASRTFDSVSALVDLYFYKKEFDNRIRQKSQDILKVLANASSRLNKKLKLLEKELQECQNKENFRINGDLITANIYRLEKSDRYSLENFYDENKPLEILVDKNLTPAQNAQKFYKKYNKLKSAEYHLAKQAEIAKNDMSYVESVFESLTRALSERELAEIRAELSESGFTKPAQPGKTEKSGQKPKKPQKLLPISKPSEYVSPNGFKVLCGKNNKQNDELTFKIAGKNDLWFHAQKIPGSHAILSCENAGKFPSESDIEYAAGIAAAYSKGKNMPLVPVDYTPARYVKKPNGAKPGFVTYKQFKTATVKPLELQNSPAPT